LKLTHTTLKVVKANDVKTEESDFHTISYPNLFVPQTFRTPGVSNPYCNPNLHFNINA